MESPLRAGILGGGFMAEVHSRAIRAAGHEVIMISSSSPEKSAEAASRLGVRHVAADARRLVESESVDVVHVCTPNAFHAEQAELAIAVGKPVVCEKPLATSVRDATNLVSRAAESKTPTAVPFVYRYYPAVREIRSRILRGDAGELHLLHGAYLQDWLALPTATNWRVNEAVGGASRTFADIGVHWCDAMEFVTGHRITRLVSLLARPHPARGATEDSASILFETDRGASGTLIASQISHGRKNQLAFSFDGELESFEWNQEHPGQFSASTPNGSTNVNVGSVELAAASAQELAYLPAGHPQGYQDAFNAFMADAYASFQGDVAPDLPTFEDGLRAAVITEAVLQSAQSRQWVDVARVAAPAIH
ncbi:Gfo/Idh/MocA family oxidoreductase [Alpinimonas psychrophila]|uniref:Putative dehydrogenase n=1 Tax=Alpinimonas psychrophila TaxID=748908 RepID=A0A7W3JRK5_9MICO|nr:Gfo/Idh/MocA family oxidoreductase [Alpinimonas psychrophila]MBA8827938.1 putative dehydrogenase [Alpinimonas psychrophila]